MNVVFGSVVYPGALEYAGDFLDSLNNQTDKDFSLLLINDGVKNDAITKIMDGYNNKYNIISYEESFSPPELRINLLREAFKNNCDYLVLGDIDDYFAANRVEKIKRMFCDDEHVGFLYNEILLTNENTCMPRMPEKVISVDAIAEFNFLGLSNTAINMKGLDLSFIDSLTECKTYVFDWYLYSRLILNGMNGRFLPGTFTYYRLHENNCAGIPSLTDEMVEKEVAVKINHYSLLATYDIRYKKMLSAYKNGDYERIQKNSYYWWNLTKRIEK